MTPAPASGPTFIHASDNARFAVLDVSGAFALVLALLGGVERVEPTAISAPEPVERDAVVALDHPD